MSFIDITSSMMSDSQSLASIYMDLLKQAALLNSVGVTALMAYGESSDLCLEVFNEALKVMEHVTLSPYLEKVGNKPPGVWNSVPCAHLNDDRFYVCPQALLFAVLDKDKPVVSEADVSFFSAIVIYNMALTYHQRGLRALKRGQDNASMLNSALQLYRRCHEVLLTILSPPGDDTDRLKLVVLNNQAQIHYMTQDFAQSQDMLHKIRLLYPQLLSNNLSESTHSPQGSLFHSPKTLKEISMNVLLVTGPPSTAAMA